MTWWIIIEYLFLYDFREDPPPSAESVARSSQSWEVLLPDLSLDAKIHSGQAEVNLNKKKTYYFAIQATEGEDHTDANDSGASVEIPGGRSNSHMNLCQVVVNVTLHDGRAQ